MSAEFPPEPLRGASAAHALDAWAAARASAGCVSGTGVERVPVTEAAGRITSEPVIALRASPAFDCAAMDGIAVRAADTAGATAADYVVVDTGDPMPDGYDAVVMREHVRYDGGGPDGAPPLAQLDEPATPGRHVRPTGEDIAVGEVLLPAGHRLRPPDLAAAAAAGHTVLTVRQKPVVVIIPTGDEIRPIGAELKRGDILDTNSLMLAAQARELGCDARVTPVVPDDPELLRAAVRAAAENSAHLVVLIAGSSAGRDDHTADVVQKAGRLAVHEVAVRPGHPVVLGVAFGVPVLGAPGYPVSAALTFEIFAAPLLAELQGASAPQRPVVEARLDQDIRSPDGSEDWIRVHLSRQGDELLATPLPRRAGVLTSLVRADGLLVIPAGVGFLAGGARVQVRLLGGYASVESGARTR